MHLGSDPRKDGYNAAAASIRSNNPPTPLRQFRDSRFRKGDTSGLSVTHEPVQICLQDRYPFPGVACIGVEVSSVLLACWVLAKGTQSQMGRVNHRRTPAPKTYGVGLDLLVAMCGIRRTDALQSVYH